MPHAAAATPAPLLSEDNISNGLLDEYNDDLTCTKNQPTSQTGF